jgi:hypothetical protein
VAQREPKKDFVDAYRFGLTNEQMGTAIVEGS